MPDPRPHSRACGIGQHDHGQACARDCPTCRTSILGPIEFTPVPPTEFGVHFEPLDPGPEFSGNPFMVVEAAVVTLAGVEVYREIVRRHEHTYPEGVRRQQTEAVMAGFARRLAVVLADDA